MEHFDRRDFHLVWKLSLEELPDAVINQKKIFEMIKVLDHFTILGPSEGEC